MNMPSFSHNRNLGMIITGGIVLIFSFVVFSLMISFTGDFNDLLQIQQKTKTIMKKQGVEGELARHQTYLESQIEKKTESAGFKSWAIVIISFFILLIAISPHIMVLKQIDLLTDQLNEVAVKGAKGDFTIDVDMEITSCLGSDLPKHVNRILKNVRSLIKEVMTIHLNMIKITGKLGTSYSEQSQNYVEHSSAITEITSTIEELFSSASNVAENTKNVLKLSEETLMISKEGQQLAENTMLGMEKIRNDTLEATNKISELGKKSQKIGEVLTIINEIAKQTKFLSLNAAIEAAKAGEYGKGFEVVSTEIRDLAENVVKSTGRIKNIIADIHDSVTSSIMANELGTKQVELGLKSTKQNRNALVEIVSMAKKTTNSTKQIGIATQQQRVANQQVLMGMKEISKTNQEIDLKIREATDFVSSIDNSVNELSRLLTRYKV